MADRPLLAAFLAQRQGLLGPKVEDGPAAVLQRAGWARTVGGANPYLTVFSRAGIRRKVLDRALADQMVEEVPAARSCAYLLPKGEVWIGLRAAEGGSRADQRRGEKVGVTAEETESLCNAVVSALESGPLAPNQLRTVLGDRVRSLGPDGKKQGLSTTLPLALGKLQEEGRIGRVPLDGRLDTERYRYRARCPSPLESAPCREEALRRLAALYWHWIGVASIAQFRWFAGLGAKAAEAAIDGLGLTDVGADGLMATVETLDGLEAFRMPDSPDCRLVSSMDSLFLLRREVASLFGEGGLARLEAVSGKGTASGGLADLEFNAIVDRGTVVGLWEFDPDEGKIFHTSWADDERAVRAAVEATESFIRDDLGDCRSFSLDSPQSRKPRLDALKG